MKLLVGLRFCGVDVLLLGLSNIRYVLISLRLLLLMLSNSSSSLHDMVWRFVAGRQLVKWQLAVLGV